MQKSRPDPRFLPSLSFIDRLLVPGSYSCGVLVLNLLNVVPVGIAVQNQRQCKTTVPYGTVLYSCTTKTIRIRYCVYVCMLVSGKSTQYYQQLSTSSYLLTTSRCMLYSVRVLYARAMHSYCHLGTVMYICTYNTILHARTMHTVVYMHRSLFFYL